MTEQPETRPMAGITMAPLQGYMKRLWTVQAEMAEGMIELNRHWLEQTRVEWAEALELARKFTSNDTTSDKVAALQDWLKAATERGVQDIKHTMEAARALGNIELKLLARPSDQPENKDIKAA